MSELRILAGRGAVPEVVGGLRDLLARAEAGEIVGFAIATAVQGRCTGSAFALGEGSVDQLVTGLERVKLRLLDL